MKKSLLTMAAALALVSCSQDELLPNGSETVANGKIGANIFVPTTTRGAALNTVEDLISSQNGFDLISYYNDGSDNYELFMGTTDDGIQFKHDGSAWDYANRGEIHFWQSVPDEATDMKFFAVSPTKENLPTGASYSIEAESQSITYAVPETVSEQKDLMFAQKNLADGEYESTSEVYRNGVPLNFHHALSQIVFKARIADKEDTDGNGTSNYVTAYVNSVSVKNVHGAGTFDMNAASAILGESYYEDGDLDGMNYDNTLWTPSDDATNEYTVSELTNNAEITWIEAEDLTNGAIGTETAMLLLPQQLEALDLSNIGTDVNSANEEQMSVVDRSAGAYLEVNCRVVYTGTNGTPTYIVGEDENSFAKIYIPISTNWQPGYKYVYTLIFSADSGDPVKAIVESVDEWNTAAGDNNGSDDNDDTDDSNMLLLNMNAADMFVGDEIEILMQTNTRNSDATLTFTYPNDEMFETTDDNKIKAKQPGQAEVIVSCEGYEDATVTINVMPAIEDTELTEGIKTVRITGNTYIMGNDYLTEDMYGNLVNAPSHSVTVNDFIIGQYEVSVGQYVQFLNKNTQAFSITEIDGKKVAAYTYNDYSLDESEQTRYIPLCILDQNGIEGEAIGSLTIKSGSEKLPVICSWEGAATFAKSVGGYLPHEEEWEYAARGGVHQKYAWWQEAVGYDGEDWYGYDENKTAEDIKSLIEEYENFPIQSAETDGESYITTHTLRNIESTEKGNAYGLYDVFGNVSEWCGNYDYDYNTGLGNETDHRFRGDLPTLAVFGESSVHVGIHNFYGVAYRDINADMLNQTNFYTGFRVAFASDYNGANSSVQTVSQGE